jgi:hypothetical protein
VQNFSAVAADQITLRLWKISRLLSTRLASYCSTLFRKSFGEREKVSAFSGARQIAEILRFAKDDSGAGLVGGNTQELHGDVIGATTFQGHSHKLHAAVCHRLSLCEAGEILLCDKTPEAVGAEDEHIIIFQFDRLFRDVRNDVMPRSESCSQNVTLGMGLGIFGADDPVLYEAANVGMVARQP